MKKLLPIVFIFIYSFSFSQITLSETHTNISCFGGSNGSATVTANGGTAPYTYTWTPFNTNSPTIVGMAAAQYTVTVMDALANTNSLVVTISEPSQLNVFTSSNNTCGGNCSGSAYITASGGTPAYSYTWSNGSSLTWVQNLCAGTYTVGVTDMNGCVAFNTVAIIQMPLLNVSVSQTNTTCYSSCNGEASANITNGTGSYTYQWYPGGVTTSSITNLCIGNNTLIVQDATGCSASYTFNIVQTGTISNLSATLTSLNETCLQSGDGQINLSLSGSNPGPFTYQWSNGAISQNIYNVTTNNYWVEISDGTPTGCLSLQTNLSYIGINCGSIAGNVYIDNNSDCIKNAGDNNYNNASIIVNPGNRFAYTNTNGDYIVNNLPYGTYSVSLGNISGAVFPTCTTTLNTTVSAGNPNSVNNNLSVGFNSVVQPDLNVYAGSQGIVPGFVCRVNYYLNNLNNVGCSGVYKVTLPSAFIPNITNAFPSTYTLSGDTIIWNFSNVIYFSATTLFYIDFTVPLSTPLGSTFVSCISAQPTITDLNYANNTYCYSRTVTGSFDPNDKSVSPVGVGIDGYILSVETDLTYLIRFQNTGNGPAVNIMVKDTLSPNVDITTFEMLSASHTYRMDILEGNVLRWRFNNIMLADSNSNEPASHGYIQYRIKRTANNTPGTKIKNTAYIYFDFNDPVVTNTTLNTIETVTGINSQNKTENDLLVYPNPSTGIIYLINNTLQKENKVQIQVVNSIGKVVYSDITTTANKTLDLSKLNNGVYFIKLISEKQSVIKRVVLSK